MKKLILIIFKILKWGFVVFIVGFIILLISIYISSLNSYKESDFNIPKDFFDTTHSDKNPLSEENGFNDFTSFLEDLNIKRTRKVHLEYYKILSGCSLKDKYYLKSFERDTSGINFEEFCQKKKKEYFNRVVYYHDISGDISQKIKKSDKKIFKKIEKYTIIINIKDFDKEIAILNEKISKMEDSFLKARYIKDVKKYKTYKQIEIDNSDDFSTALKIYLNITDEDIDLYYEDLKRIEKFKKETKLKSLRQLKNFIAVNSIKYKKITNKNFVLQTRVNVTIHTSGISNYTSSLGYIAYIYFENGEYEKGINLLLDFQTFINNLKIKGDFESLRAEHILYSERRNVNYIYYFIENYELSEKLQNNIIDSLSVANHKELIKNGIKWAYQAESRFLNTREVNNNRKLKGYILGRLFYSREESQLLNKKSYYDIINNLGNTFKTDLNINNYLGRNININNSNGYYSNPYRLVEEITTLKEEIINKLK